MYTVTVSGDRDFSKQFNSHQEAREYCANTRLYTSAKTGNAPTMYINNEKYGY